MSHFFSKTLSFVLALSLAVALSWPALAPRHSAEAADLSGEAMWTHDPSRIIECGGKYYLYTTGDNLPMKTSTDLVNWTKGPSVLPKVPDWARKAVPAAKTDFVWAPDVILVGGKYFLYYSFSTFGSIVSVTGLLTSPTLDPANPAYKWTDEGLVVASKEGSDFNAIDPAPILNAQGDLWMTLGSWNRGGIKLFKMDKATGKIVGKAQTLAAGQATGPEAPYLHFRDGYYYLFENEGTCCAGLNSSYRIMMGRSKTVTGPYLDRDGKDLAKGGGSPFLASDGEKVGPGHIGIVAANGHNYFTFHFYDGRSNGVPTLGLQTVVWGADGWPVAGADLRPGRYAIVSKASGQALGIHNNNFADGTPIDQAPYRGGPTQRWNVTPTGDGYYGISSMGSAKWLDLNECSPKGGTKISHYRWFNNDCQRWRIEQVGPDTYRIISKGGKTALTLPGGVKTPQTPVQGWAWKGDVSQQWIFQPLT